MSLRTVNRIREEKGFSGLSVLVDIKQRWEQGTLHEKEMIEADMNVIAIPGATIVLEPSVKKVKKGKDNTRLLSMHEKVDKQYKKEDRESKIGTSSNNRVVKQDRVTEVSPTVAESQSTTTTDGLPHEEIFVDEKYLKYMPLHMIPFITSTIDVGRLGNCGFEVVEKQLNLGSMARKLNLTGPQFVREKMLKNMKKQEAVYRSMWGNIGYEALVRRITVPRNAINITPDNWMLMPQCAFIIADTFSTVVHYIGKDWSCTFAPATVKMSKRTKNKSMAIGFVEGDHFIGLNLSGNCPLPPEPNLDYWENAKNEWSEEWLSQYELRISQWLYLCGLQGRLPDTISVPINIDED